MSNNSFVMKILHTMFFFETPTTFALSSFSFDMLFRAIVDHNLTKQSTVADIQNLLVYHLLQGLCAVFASSECLSFLALADPHQLKLDILNIVITHACNENTSIVEICMLCKTLRLDCFLHCCNLLIDFLSFVAKLFGLPDWKHF